MITAPLPRASPSGTGRLSMIIPRFYGLTITYSGTSEKGTLWDQYKFKWFVPFIEVVLF